MKCLILKDSIEHFLLNDGFNLHKVYGFICFLQLLNNELNNVLQII